MKIWLQQPGLDAAAATSSQLTKGKQRRNASAMGASS